MQVLSERDVAAAFAGRCKVGRTVNFTKYVERMPARWRAKDARAHGRA